MSDTLTPEERAAIAGFRGRVEVCPPRKHALDPTKGDHWSVGFRSVTDSLRRRGFDPLAYARKVQAERRALDMAGGEASGAVEIGKPKRAKRTKPTTAPPAAKFDRPLAPMRTAADAMRHSGPWGDWLDALAADDRQAMTGACIAMGREIQDRECA